MRAHPLPGRQRPRPNPPLQFLTFLVAQLHFWGFAHPSFIASGLLVTRLMAHYTRSPEHTYRESHEL
jgi:hypothetical protein